MFCFGGVEVLVGEDPLGGWLSVGERRLGVPCRNIVFPFPHNFQNLAQDAQLLSVLEKAKFPVSSVTLFCIMAVINLAFVLVAIPRFQLCCSSTRRAFYSK